MIFFPLLFLYLFNYSLSTLVSRSLFDREDDIVLVYGTALPIAINIFGREDADAYILQA